MPEVRPLKALRYDPAKVGGLQAVVAPPYDVIDAAQRAELAERSPYNVVHVDLPQGDGDPYQEAARILAAWRSEGAVVHEDQPTVWPLEQDYRGPDGRARTRRGFLARVRVEDYGAGRIRPHERTHPGPREDRLRLTRATKTNLSPIFSLYSDPGNDSWRALESVTARDPWAETRDPDGTVNRLWRATDPGAIESVCRLAGQGELLIADGHHRYETARVYAEEVGGEGPQRYVLMCLVALQDPGLTVFPTHRLLRGLDAERQEELAEAIRRDFEISELSSLEELPPASSDQVQIGYLDSSRQSPLRLILKDPAIADAALPDRSEPYRCLDTAVLEALILKGALQMNDEAIDHLDGLGYARNDAQAIDLVTSGQYQAAFFMAPTPISQVQAVAASGESMPPKSTYFFPKVPTGLVFNRLAD